MENINKKAKATVHKELRTQYSQNSGLFKVKETCDILQEEFEGSEQKNYQNSNTKEIIRKLKIKDQYFGRLFS